MFKFLAVAAGSLLGIGLLVAVQPAQYHDPDPELLRLAVRATVHAMPPPTPREVIVSQVVTQYVEVTRIVEVTRVVEVAAPAEAATPDPPPPVPMPQPASIPAPAAEQPAAAAAQSQPVASAAEVADKNAEETVDEAVAPAPQVAAQPVGCPAASSRQFSTIPIEGGRTDHPAHAHGDLNLALRGSQPLDAHLGLIEINGPTDGDAPQIAGIFGDGRVPQFAGLHRVFDWNWGCGERGCRGEPLGYPEGTLALMRVGSGETLNAPRRRAEIYGGGYVALVLYATDHSITLGYTREDSVANGYAVHLDRICVDPNLLAAYRAAEGQGRSALPALRNGEALGTAHGELLHIAIRDRGMFKDPRSRKDWWQ